MKNDIQIAYIDLGVVLTEKHQHEDAVAALQRAVELDPSQPDAHYRLARVYKAMGKISESQKEYAKVQELHQESDDSLASKIATPPPPLPQ
jgi:Tfp pilus assembly protein PilF